MVEQLVANQLMAVRFRLPASTFNLLKYFLYERNNWDIFPDDHNPVLGLHLVPSKGWGGVAQELYDRQRLLHGGPIGPSD